MATPSRSPYKQVLDGEWIKPRHRGWKMACCDCGLVHTVNLKVIGGRVYLQPTRDNRATAAKRRYKLRDHSSNW